MVARRRRRFCTTTDSKHGFPIAPNVLARNFSANRPDQVWVTDITFLWTQQGWLYLAAILDLYSRRVVGWATSEHVDRQLALAALDVALRLRSPARDLVHHSDRGSTYASDDYRNALETRGIECSMSRKGDCYDNAVAESFFATLKREMAKADDLESRAPATLPISEYIDGFYNSNAATRPSTTSAPSNLNSTVREQSSVTKPSTRSGQPHSPRLLDRVRSVIRARHLSPRTETAS